MMTCNCRTAALRIFVRSITRAIAPESSLVPRNVRFPNLQFRLIPTRSFHNTARLLNGPDGATSIHGQHDVSLRPKSVTNTEKASGPPRQASESSPGVTKVSRRGRTRSRSTETGVPERKRRTKKVGEDSADVDGVQPVQKKRGRPTGSKKPEQPKTATVQPGNEDEPRTPEEWKAHKASLKEKFPDGWNPRKKLSPDALEGIRALHEQYPDMFTTEALAERFQVSPEAIRRILKSNWRATPEKEEERQERWFKRGKKVWARWAELGKKPPARWRMEGIVRDPSWHQRRVPPEERLHFDVHTLSKGKKMRLLERARRRRLEQSEQDKEKDRLENAKSPQQWLSETLV